MPARGEGRRHLLRVWRARPTVRGLIVLVAGAVALVSGYVVARPEYFAVTGAAVALLASAFVVVHRRRPRLDVRRTFSPPVIAAGSATTVRLHLGNRGAGPTPAAQWNDALPWPQPAAPAELAPIPARAGAERVVEHVVRPPRRGLVAIGPLVVEYEDPFGLVVATVAVGDPDRLVVVPPVSSLGDSGPVPPGGDGEARVVRRRATGAEDDQSTREYRPGDALRRVHWRASARHGELMVRQEEHRTHPDARVLLDTRRGGYPDAAPDDGASWSAEWSSDAFEWAVRMVASLGVHLAAAGFRVAVEETGPPQLDAIGPRPDGRSTDGFLTSLADVQLRDRPGGELQILPSPDPSGPLFAVLGDPERATLDRLIRRRGTEPGFAFLVGASRVAHDRLRAAGWTTVDVDLGDDPALAWSTAALEVPHGGR